MTMSVEMETENVQINEELKRPTESEGPPSVATSRMLLLKSGATPDGVTECECCGAGLTEIKCPYKYR